MNFEQYQAAIEESNIVSKTDINGIITFVNDEFCKISGFTRDELIGSNHNIVRHPDVPKNNFKKLWDTILSKKVPKSVVKNKTKNGDAFYVNTTIIPIIGDDGSIDEFVAIRHDVTDIVLLNKALEKKEIQLKQLNLTLEQRVKQQTEELKNLNKNLENRVAFEVEKNKEKSRLLFQQARLASMGEMIGNIAHQWRQPLLELGIDLYKMKKDFLTKNKIIFMEDYEHAKIIIKKMSQTIDDFRDFFNTKKPKEIFCIQSSIDEAIVILKGTLKKEEINIIIKGNKKIKIYGFNSELTQVIVNIINNSKDAFKNINIPNKKISISISNLNKENAIISISDNAGGIDKKVMDRIFEPYYTTKHPNIGTGLGLYISKMIIETSMNGSIYVQNISKGTCIEIILPKIMVKNIKEEG